MQKQRPKQSMIWHKATEHRRILKRLMCAAILMAAMQGCGSRARTAVEYDPAINFKNYRTYSWQRGTPAPIGRMDQRIVRALDRELQKKGLQPVASGGDLEVSYHISVGRALEVATWDYPTSAYWTNTWGLRTDVQVIPEGLLVVDLIDGRRNQTVWRGVALDELSASETDLESKIGYVTAELFEEYPPRR